MRTVGVLALALGLVSGVARAEEQGGWPIDVGVRALAAVGTGPQLRAAPAIGLDLGLGLPGGRFLLYGSVGGWTFQDVGTTPSQSELALSAGAAVRGALSDAWGWQLAAAPTFLAQDTAGQAMAYRAGLLVAPSVELATRRKSLRFQLGGRGLVDSEGLRLLAGGGVTYTFW